MNIIHLILEELIKYGEFNICQQHRMELLAGSLDPTMDFKFIEYALLATANSK